MIITTSINVGPSDLRRFSLFIFRFCTTAMIDCFKNVSTYYVMCQCTLLQHHLIPDYDKK